MATSRGFFTTEDQESKSETPVAVEAAPQQNIRTAAQGEASRINGAKSRGPRSVEGKKRSRMNAVTHGLLARHFAPCEDYRQEHTEYGLQLAGLVDEYEPCTQTQWNLVEGLAADFVRLGRVGQVREQQFTPADSRAYTCGYTLLDVAERVRAFNALERLSRKLVHGELLDARDEDLRLAVKYIQLDAENIRGDAVAHRSVRSKKEAKRLKVENSEAIKWFRRIGPQKLGVFKERTLKTILSGDASILPEVQDRWVEILCSAAALAKHSAEFVRAKRVDHENLCRRGLTRNFESNLTLLSMTATYEARCRAEMEKKIKLLLKLRRVRSRSQI